MKKELFDKKYVGGNKIVRCKTEKLANKFLIEAHRHGYKWNEGESYLNEHTFVVNNKWKKFKQWTYYSLYNGTYGGFSMLGYDIVDFNGFLEDVDDELNQHHRNLFTDVVKKNDIFQMGNLPIFDDIFETLFKAKNYVNVFDFREHFLPNKVVFNEKNGKTTLLFKNIHVSTSEYTVFTSQAVHGDKFEYGYGLIVSLYKSLFPNHKEMLDFHSGLDSQDSKTLYIGIYYTVLQKLRELGMSFNQIKKFIRWDMETPLKFVIKGVEHIIEVEYKNKKESEGNEK